MSNNSNNLFLHADGDSFFVSCEVSENPKYKPSDIKYAGGLEKLVGAIKDEINNKLGVTYSFGLGRTKALAKTASKLNKPNGMVLLLNEKDEENTLKKILNLWYNIKIHEQIYKIEKEIGLDELKGMFEGKLVHITNEDPMIIETEGICKEAKVSKEENFYEILLTNGMGYLIKPKEIGDNFVKGELPDEAKGNRRIEVINK